MPIFYNSEDHVKFIQVVKNFKPLDEDIFYDHLILKDEDIYGFQYWWNKISYAPLYNVYLCGGGANYRCADTNGLPHYIRCVHHHFSWRVKSFFFSMNLLFFFLVVYYYTCLIITKFFDVLNNRVIITMNLQIDTCTYGIQHIVRRY